MSDELFDMIDEDNSGTIDIVEFKNFTRLHREPDPDVAAAINLIHEDGSTDPTGKGSNIKRDRPGTVKLLEDPDLSDDDIEFSC